MVTDRSTSVWGGMLAGSEHRAGGVERLAIHEYQRIGGGPGAGADIAQPPGLGEGLSRQEGGVIVHGDVIDEVDQVRAVALGGCDGGGGRQGGGDGGGFGGGGRWLGGGR